MLKSYKEQTNKLTNKQTNFFKTEILREKNLTTE